MSERALVLCPGRGSYTRESLGSLKGMGQHVPAAFDAIRRSAGRPTAAEMDAEARFSPRLHLAGENASTLTAAITLADLAQLDPEKVRVVAVCGNSMGWYTALGYAGALSLHDCARLIETMGQYQADNVIGGQAVYPVVGDDWRPDPALQQAVDAALAEIPDLHASIRLGSQIVLAGTEAALAEAGKRLPALQRGAYTYPLRLPLHSAFHTPLMASAAAQAARDLADLGWSAPRVPLIDGQGRTWRPLHADPDALAGYTLGPQVVATYDFTAMLRAALREYAPSRIVLPGPGDSLGGAVAGVLIQEGWAGIRSKADFLARQASDPVLVSMRRPDQRPRVAS